MEERFSSVLVALPPSPVLFVVEAHQQQPLLGGSVVAYLSPVISPEQPAGTDRVDRIADSRGVPPPFFHQVYADGTPPPPWEIERVQSGVREAHARGWFSSTVLDVGCGTGCNAIFLAEAGLEVLGTDLVPRAIKAARARVLEAGVAARVRFEVANACDMRSVVEDGLASSVLDCGFCHVLSDADRPTYVAELLRCTQRGASIVFLNFSEHELRGGPRRMSIADFASMLGSAFQLTDSIPSAYESTAHAGGASAWLLRFIR